MTHHWKHIPEVDFHATVAGMMKAFGWNLIYHTHNSERSESGFPDLFAIKSGKYPRMLIAELKREKGQPTPEQHQWLQELQAFHCQGWIPDRGFSVEVYLWRPSDLDDIERILK